MLKKILFPLIFFFAFTACNSSKDKGESYDPYANRVNERANDNVNSVYNGEGSDNSDNQGFEVETGELGTFDLVPGGSNGARRDDRVFFDYDSAALTYEAQSILDRQAAWFRDNGSTRVVIEGHSDERGTREYNLALGDRRANAVKSYLVSSGIPSSSITVVSYGKEKPAAFGSGPSAWAENRRAVTIVQ